MKTCSLFTVSALGLLMSGPLYAQTIGDANTAAKSYGTSPSGSPIDNPTQGGPTPIGTPPPINDPSKGSSQGDPGNKVPLLAPPPAGIEGTVVSSATVGDDASGASGGR